MSFLSEIYKFKNRTAIISKNDWCFATIKIAPWGTLPRISTLKPTIQEAVQTTQRQ